MDKGRDLLPLRPRRTAFPVARTPMSILRKYSIGTIGRAKSIT
jgi:hypothetical protein